MPRSIDRSGFTHEDLHDITDIAEDTLVKFNFKHDKCFMLEKWGSTFLLIFKSKQVETAQFFQVFMIMMAEVQESTNYEFELEVSSGQTLSLAGKVRSIDENKATIFAIGNANLIAVTSKDLEFKVKIRNEKLEEIAKDQEYESGVEDDD